MNFEPQKFFIGVMDFFSILLPGAILTWLFADPALSLLTNGTSSAELDSAEAWIAFGIVSYLAGHLLFLIGSWLDLIYDAVRRCTINKQIDRVLRGDRLSPAPARILARLVFKRERDLAVERVGDIRKAALGPLGAAGAINTFQWSKAFLNSESPTALAAVQRIEADSKFFRCFTVLLLALLLFWWWWQPNRVLALIALVVLLPLSFWRFMEQRFKATNQAYWFVLTITAKSAARTAEDAPADAPPAEAPPAATHAGGVVFRDRGERREYLLIEAAERKDEWVIPKGRIEFRESPEYAAVREVHEEAGVWAQPDGTVGHAVWPAREGGSPQRVEVFLMRAVGRGVADETRKTVWLSLESAVERATYEETRQLLRDADARSRGTDVHTG